MSLQAMMTDHMSVSRSLMSRLNYWCHAITDDVYEKTYEACMNERAARLSNLRTLKILKLYLANNLQDYPYISILY